MADRSATAALLGGVALLERAINYTLGSLLLVTPQLMSRPTPCQDWDLRTLLIHMNDSFDALCEAVDDGQVSLTPSEFDRDADPVAALLRFAAPVPVPADARPADRLLGFLGRQPR